MIPVKVLAVQYLNNCAPSLLKALGVSQKLPSLGLLTTDCDDATFIALDGATKAAEVEVVYGRSFYAGASNASTPYAGEVLGILAGATPGAVKSGMEAALEILSRVGFQNVKGIPCLSCTVPSTGSFLSREAGIPQGGALAYLIAPPLEAVYGLDAALKAADVKLSAFYAPPTQTNFGGGLLTGTQSACASASEAFLEAVAEVAERPVK